MRRVVRPVSLWIAVVPSVVIAACGSDRVIVAFETPDASTPSGPFDTPERDASADGPESPEFALCPATECPDPYATCGTTPSLICTTNLKTNNEHCGVCGTSCTKLAEGRANMSARCVNGECAFECIARPGHSYRDCNGILEDGCEADVYWDDANCGVCGHACAPGVHCNNGKCGCPFGQRDCDGKCVDLRADPKNCGACGKVCNDPDDACSPMPPNTLYTCVDGECGRLNCKADFVNRYADCDDDLRLGCASNGCEVNLAFSTSPCGACNEFCTPEQECRNDGNGRQCLDPCEKSGMAQCAAGCRDLRSDPANCGACGNSCPFPQAHQVRACKKGICAMDCEYGFADCNGDPTDGCEVDLRSHPGNCGACGHECNFAEGQPCINGACLMGPCDAGVVVPK